MNRKLILYVAIGVLSVFPQIAFPVDYPNKLDGKAAIACKFESVAFIDRKLEFLDKYLTQDFIEHNAWVLTNDLESFRKAVAKLPELEGTGGQSGCPAPKLVVQQGDYVVFLRECTRLHCASTGPLLPAPVTQFDIYRFEGDKIAEHWDSIQKH